MAFDKPSLTMRLAVLAVRLAFRKNAKSAEQLRKQLMSRTYPEAPEPPSSLKRLCTIVKERHPNGFPVWRLTPRRNRSNGHLLYIHGGAYIIQLMKPHWWIIENIVRQLGIGVTVPLYPLAPEYDYRAGFAMIDTVYDDLIAKVGAKNLIVGGDSAGGGFSLSLAQRLVAAGRPVPSALLLFAPWPDVTMSDPGSQQIETEDPMLTLGAARLGGTLWSGGLERRDPVISPGFGAVEGLPPLTIFQGTADILLPDVRRFVSRAEQAGIAVNYFEYKGAFHVFAGIPFLPESKDVYKKIRKIFGGAT